MSTVVVIGAGVGGLVTAIRLAVAGHDVTVVERAPDVGGKLATERRDGFTFDLGPSLLTLPHVFDDVFRAAGTTLADEVQLVRLDPQFRSHWPDGSELVVPDSPGERRDAFEAFSPGAGAQWAAFDARAERIWEVSERTFLAGTMGDPIALLRRMRSPVDLVAIDPLRTLDRAARSSFADPRLQQWVGRYATYSGSSPYRAPATLACIAHVESRYGCWYTMGGLGALRDALACTARRLAVDFRTGCEAAAIVSDDRRVRGVDLVSGERVRADVVVADVDAEHLYEDLLPDGRRLRRARRAGRSTSGFVLLVGVRGTTPDIAHHNVWFAADARAEFDALARGELADDVTIYASVPTVTDASRAPGGCESWFLMVNAPARCELDPDATGDRVLELLATRGPDLRDRIEVRFAMTPADLASRFRAPGGAIYGTSSDGRRAAFARPANRGPRRGLYLAGGSSHPGGGLPLVAISGRIVADLVRDDLARGVVA